MNWKKIDPNDLPKGEVLCRNSHFDKRSLGEAEIRCKDEIYCIDKKINTEYIYSPVDEYFDPNDLKEPEAPCLYGDRGIITGSDENGNLTFKQSEPDD